MSSMETKGGALAPPFLLLTERGVRLNQARIKPDMALARRVNPLESLLYFC